MSGKVGNMAGYYTRVAQELIIEAAALRISIKEDEAKLHIIDRRLGNMLCEKLRLEDT
jgi:hypothetical protein